MLEALYGILTMGLVLVRYATCVRWKGVTLVSDLSTSAESRVLPLDRSNELTKILIIFKFFRRLTFTGHRADVSVI